MKKLLIVTYYKYPDGDAGSVRQYNFAKLYKDLGFDVTVVGMGPCTNFSLREDNGVPYISFREDKADFISKLKNYFGYKARLKAFLKNHGDCDYIQIVDIPPNALFFVKRYAKKHNIKLIHDSVEWYSPEQFKKGKNDINYILKNSYNTKWIDKQFSVIAISSFLEKHFNSRGINTVRIPVIMDVEGISYEKRTNEEKTVFFYAGLPGKKDYLSDIIKGFSLLSQDVLSKCELRIAGVSKEQLISLCGVEADTLEKVEDILFCLGRIPRADVLGELQRADFTVLLRSETQRYAKAGFPTKVVESLSLATPVITNLTSDLGLYLRDGYNAKIVADSSPKALADTINGAVRLSFEDRKIMYENSRKTAEDCFDYRLYADILSKII